MERVINCAAWLVGASACRAGGQKSGGRRTERRKEWWRGPGHKGGGEGKADAAKTEAANAEAQRQGEESGSTRREAGKGETAKAGVWKGQDTSETKSGRAPRDVRPGIHGGPCRTRTCNQGIMSPLLRH